MPRVAGSFHPFPPPQGRGSREPRGGKPRPPRTRRRRSDLVERLGRGPPGVPARLASPPCPAALAHVAPGTTWGAQSEGAACWPGDRTPGARGGELDLDVRGRPPRSLPGSGPCELGTLPTAREQPSPPGRQSGHASALLLPCAGTPSAYLSRLGSRGPRLRPEVPVSASWVALTAAFRSPLRSGRR